MIMFSDIATYCLRSRVKIIKRAAFFTCFDVFKISLKSIFGLLPFSSSPDLSSEVVEVLACQEEMSYRLITSATLKCGV
jgi:hypothetical protein